MEAQAYYDELRFTFKGDREALNANFPVIVHPMDKTDNYIKRCVAVSGDIVQVKNGSLFINQARFVPPVLKQNMPLKRMVPFNE